MSFGIHVLIGQKVLRLSTDMKCCHYLAPLHKSIQSYDGIYEVSITKELVIVVTEYPVFQEKPREEITKDDFSVNNIDAYRWDGEHLWNIADILGEIKAFCYGGMLVTKQTYLDFPGYDPSIVPDGHDLFMVWVDDSGYLVDLEERRLIQILYGFR